MPLTTDQATGLLPNSVICDLMIPWLASGSAKPFQITELQLRVRNLLLSKQQQREWVQASLSNPDPASPRLTTESADPFQI